MTDRSTADRIGQVLQKTAVAMSFGTRSLLFPLAKTERSAAQGHQCPSAFCLAALAGLAGGFLPGAYGTAPAFPDVVTSTKAGRKRKDKDVCL